MKNIQKLVLPALVSLAGLTAFEAHATTTAGTVITNSASLGYQVNGVDQTSVTAKANVAVDVKVDFTVTRPGTAVNGSTVTTYNSNEYYVAGVFEVANTGNTQALFNLSAAELASATSLTYTAGAIADTINLSTGSYVIVADTDGSATLNDADTDVTSTTLTLPQDQTTGTKVYVLAPKASVVGINNDVLGVQLTGAVGSVIHRTFSIDANNAVTYGSNTTVAVTTMNTGANDLTAVDLVYADTDGNNSESATDALQLTFPSFPPYTDDNNDNNDGFKKVATVVWDPINDTTNPKAIPGAVVQYTITIKNLGGMAASNVTINDPLPADTTYCDASILSQCAAPAAGSADTQAADTGTLVYTSGTDSVGAVYTSFAAGGVATIVFYVTVD